MNLEQVEREQEQLQEQVTSEQGTNTLFKIMLSNNYHILLAGSTGSGKSVLINRFLCEYLKTCGAKDSIYICDPKRVGFMPFKKCKAVKLLSTDFTHISNTIDCTIKNMNLRYKYMETAQIDEFPGGEILLIIDEFADLITGNKAIESKVIELLRLGRQAKIRLLLATQAPQRQVITASIQQNCGLRIGLRTTSRIESTQIIGVKGCENLPKYGSCLVLEPGEPITPYQIPLTTKDQIIETIANYRR